MKTPGTEQPDTYDIRISGHLGKHWAGQLGIPDLTHEADGTTLLRAVIVDQAALHGLLQRIRDLGAPLVSVTPTPSRQPTSRRSE